MSVGELDRGSQTRIACREEVGLPEIPEEEPAEDSADSEQRENPKEQVAEVDAIADGAPA